MTMVIEWLKFSVPSEAREHFIQKDLEIWSPFLEKSPGFVNKEIWISPTDEREVVVIVRWASREQWKSISEDDLAAIAQQFDTAVGVDYDTVESKEFQVRRFPQAATSSRSMG